MTKKGANEQVKSMIIVFFHCKGIVHKEFVPIRQIVNAAFYVQVLNRLRKRVVHVCPENQHAWFLHHNVLSHTVLTVREFLRTKNIPTLPQSPYSPDMVPCNFFLFPHIKCNPKRNHFGAIENVQAAVTRTLKVYPLRTSSAVNEEWQQHWMRCTDSHRDYFENY